LTRTPASVWEGGYFFDHLGARRLMFDPLTDAQELSFSRGFGVNLSLDRTRVGLTSAAHSTWTKARLWISDYVPALRPPPQESTYSCRLYDFPQKRYLATIHEPFACFSPDGRLVATLADEGKTADDQFFARRADGGKTIHVWNVPPRPPWLRILSWSLLPAGIVVLVGAWRAWRSNHRLRFLGVPHSLKNQI
jgi:hypothetical protein